jgi:hypothetical protein
VRSDLHASLPAGHQHQPGPAVGLLVGLPPHGFHGQGSLTCMEARSAFGRPWTAPAVEAARIPGRPGWARRWLDTQAPEGRWISQRRSSSRGERRETVWRRGTRRLSPIGRVPPSQEPRGGDAHG